MRKSKGKGKVGKMDYKKDYTSKEEDKETPPVVEPEPPAEPVEEPVEAPVEAPVESPTETPVETPVEAPKDALAPTEVSTEEFMDPRPHGKMHKVTVYENHDPTQLMKYHAVCSCGFEARSNSLKGPHSIDAAFETHKGVHLV